MISRYCASDFPAKSTGYIYTLRDPDDGYIFYVGKTLNRESRLTSHIAEAKRNALNNTESDKERRILSILDKGKKPVMGYVVEVQLRTEYDKWYYDYLEYYWMRNYINYGWELTNIRISDFLVNEHKLKNLIKSAKDSGGLEPKHFYFRNDEKGYPIYDIKKIGELGYFFSKGQFASHWAYIINPEKYENVTETTMDYCYGDVWSDESLNRHYYEMCDQEPPDNVRYKRFY
jgi:hypothetical protein